MNHERDLSKSTPVGSIMSKLGLRESTEEHRRVLAVPTWLAVRRELEQPS